MKAYIRILVISVFVLLLGSFAFAAGLKDLKGVQLNDGTLIHGRVIELNVYKVVIEKKDGNRESVKFDEVSHFLKDEPIEEKPGQEKTGPAEAKTSQGQAVSAEVKTDEEKALSPERAMAEASHKGTHFDLRAEISSIKYKEPDVMEEKGMMYGIVGSIAYHNDLMLKAEGRFSYGQVDYDGTTGGGTPVSANNIHDYLWEFRGLIGYDFEVLNSTVLTPYVGFGHRYLNDNFQKLSGGYERKTNYIYVPMGLEVVTYLNNGWSWGAAIEYDWFLWGKQKSYLSDFLPGLNNVNNKQNKGYGLRGSVNLVKKGDRMSFIVSPFIRYWNIRESKHSAVTYYGTYAGEAWEPNNNSTEIGCDVGVSF
jgi:hypothetical protein